MPRITPLDPQKRRKTIIRYITLGVVFLIAGGVYYLFAERYNEENLYENAEQLLRQGKHREAVQVFEHLLSKHEKGKYRSQALVDAANSYNFYLRNIPRAIELYKLIIDEKGMTQEKRVEAQERLAEMYFLDVEDLEQALAEYKALRNSVMDSAIQQKCSFQIAQIYLRQNQLEKALQEYREVVNIKGNTDFREKALLKIGNINLLLGKYQEAETPLIEVTRTAKSDDIRHQANLGLVDIWESTDKYEKALETLEAMRGDAEFEVFKQEEQKRIKEKAGILKKKSSSPWGGKKKQTSGD
jgi:tetratricopeptide (TPR) repeat protein